MREIKFRAWDGQIGMVYFTLGSACQAAFTNPLDNSKVMQYTGLKDKNGEEIYEGDIIRYQCNSAGYEINKEFAKREVSFGHGAFLCKETHGMLWACGNGCTKDGRLLDVEIIGNIYENEAKVK